MVGMLDVLPATAAHMSDGTAAGFGGGRHRDRHYISNGASWRMPKDAMF